MKKSLLRKTLLLATALVLGLGVTARAQETAAPAKSAPAASNLSLLGQTYGTLTYSYLNQDDVSSHGDTYSFSVNQPLAFGLDGVLSYDYSRSGTLAGARVKQHVLAGALRAFSTAYNWGKPYVEAGAGYAWNRYAGTRDNSFIWEIAAGAELQVTPQATLTPYVQYVEAPDLAGGGAWNFGAKASYWVDTQWAVTIGVLRDDNHNTAFTVGTNFRF